MQRISLTGCSKHRRGNTYALVHACTITDSTQNHLYGVYNLIFYVCTDSAEAQHGILPFFKKKMRVKGEAEGWWENCALACVIIRAETIERTQNAEWEISRAANYGKYGIPWLPVSLRLLCVEKQQSPPVLSTVERVKLCCPKFSLQLKCFCITSIFWENVNGMCCVLRQDTPISRSLLLDWKPRGSF